MRTDDDRPHEKEIQRREIAIAADQRAYRLTLWATGTSTMLGLVALYPIIRGTRTDNTVMMIVGFVVGMIALKILPVDKLAGLLSAWRKG